MNQQQIQEKITTAINNIVNNLTDTDYTTFSTHLSRYRIKYFIEQNSSVDAHFKKQVFNYDPNRKEKSFVDYLDNSTMLGKIFSQELQTISHSKEYIDKWVTEKKRYEKFKNKSFFIELDNIEPLEKIFLYSFLKIRKIQLLRNWSITNGAFRDFNELIRKEVSKFLVNKNALENITEDNLITDFLYQFKGFFSNNSNVNPYYDYKISLNNEIEERYIGKLPDAIKSKVFEYAKKNKINVSHKSRTEEIDKIIEGFKTSYEKDQNSYNIIVNKYFLNFLCEKIPNDLSTNNYGKYLDDLVNQYEDKIIYLTDKHPESFLYTVIESLMEKKEQNIQYIVNYIKRNKEINLPENYRIKFKI